MRLATRDNLRAAQIANEQGRLRVKLCWGPGGEPRPRWWASGQGWPAPYFGFKKTFTTKMLESQENFERAITESGVAVFVPNDLVEGKEN